MLKSFFVLVWAQTKFYHPTTSFTRLHHPKIVINATKNGKWLLIVHHSHMHINHEMMAKKETGMEKLMMKNTSETTIK